MFLTNEDCEPVSVFVERYKRWHAASGTRKVAFLNKFTSPDQMAFIAQVCSDLSLRCTPNVNNGVLRVTFG